MLQDVEGVLHLAGVNRPATAEAYDENVLLAERLVESLERIGALPSIVFANSIQSGSSTPFGQTKQAAAERLRDWGRRHRAPVADVRLPNLFGEHGRPNYNSVVATFSDALARGRTPEVIEDRELPLLHAQKAVEVMLELLDQRAEGIFAPEGTRMTVSELLGKIREMQQIYRSGDLPATVDDFDRDLFNTYRSFCFPDMFPLFPILRSDDRGDLIECMRSGGSPSQVFSSTTRPGKTRGNHFHRRKIERFAVLHGEGEIRLRRLFHSNVVTFKVSGTRPALVDMPTLWTHSITNVGQTDLTTLFWTNELFDPQAADTYAEPVDISASG